VLNTINLFIKIRYFKYNLIDMRSAPYDTVRGAGGQAACSSSVSTVPTSPGKPLNVPYDTVRGAGGLAACSSSVSTVPTSSGKPLNVVHASARQNQAGPHPPRPSDSIVGQASPVRFGSARKAAVNDGEAAAAHAAEPMSVGRQRYGILCRRLYANEEPAFARTLNGEHEGEYSTVRAEATLDVDALFTIVSTLEYCRGLHSLRLVGLQRATTSLLTREMLSAAVVAVRASASIKLLDLSDSALTDDLFANGPGSPLSRLLLNNTNLEALLLRKNELALASAKLILTHLPTNRTLIELDVSDNRGFKWPGMAKEFQLLFKENVTLVSFGASLPDPASTAVLSGFLHAPGRMRLLRLAREPLLESNIGQLVTLLTHKQCSLTELDLTYAQASDLGVTRLARALMSNRSLISLVLAHNGIATRGGLALAEALKTNCTLTSCTLTSNLLNDAAVVGLAGALSASQTLTLLDVGRNPIGPIGAQALRQALHTNKSLTSLGDLASLPLAVGLRSSLNWYLRQNVTRRDTLQLEAERTVAQRDGLLELLPPEERALRRKIFLLEDESVRLQGEQSRQALETEQVSVLLAETIKRNAQLVDTVAKLQGQVDKLRKTSAAKKRSKSAGSVRRAASKLTEAQQSAAKHLAAIQANWARAGQEQGQARARSEGKKQGLPVWAHLGGLTPLEHAQVEAVEAAARSSQSKSSGPSQSRSSGPESSGPEGSGPSGLEDSGCESSGPEAEFASAYSAGYARGFESAYAPDVLGGFQQWSPQGNFEGFAVGDGLASVLTLSPRSLAAAELSAWAAPEAINADKEARARATLVRESSD
jgi:hypothetical protein